MVFFLGVNYLEQAVAAKRNLLGKCMIAVPQHLDHVEAYLHKGNLSDEKYRSPWKRAKTDDQFLIQESINIIEDAHGLVIEDGMNKPRVESFHSQPKTSNTSLTETVNFDLNCDVIPSSNPSTQDLFSPDEFFVKHNLFQEMFEIEDLNSYCSTYDLLKIECTENTEEGLVESRLSVPDLSRLVSRLKSVHVKDPLHQENVNPVLEDSLFRNERVYCKEIETSMLQKTFNSTIVRETFQKTAVHTVSKEELEEFQTLDTSLLETGAVNLMKSEMLRSVTVPKTVIFSEDEPAVRTVTAKDVVKPDQILLQNIEKLDLSPTDTATSSFLDINAIVVTKQDQFCEKAVLDTLVMNDASSTKNYTQEKLPVPARKLFELSLSSRNLLDDETKQIMKERIWQGHRYCDEIQASRLPEPEISKKSMTREPAVKQVLKELKVQVDTTTGSADLELNWNIVKYTEEITYPCKLVVPFSTDKVVCEEQLKEVEEIEQYAAADLYDWEDKEISQNDWKGNNTENGVQDMQLIPKPKSKLVVAQAQEPCENNKNMSDPLGDFMALRSKNSTLQHWNKEDNIVCDTLLKKKELAVQLIKKQDDKTEFKQHVESKKRVKHHVVVIHITEKYQHILDILETASESCMHVLKQRGEVSPCSTFKAITPDISRFMLKQREKYLLDHKENGLSDEVYKMIVLLHGLVVASEITENCCLESAIGYLGALQEKYKDVLEGYLNDVRQKLFEIKTKVNEERIQHPKVLTMCREIETWLKKKKVKTKDNEQKILVLVKREMPSLLNCLKEALGLGNLLSPCILSSPDPEKIIESLDKHNCVIACTKAVSETFPWAQFSLVVEYENGESSPWQQLCERQNIRHIGLSMLTKDKLVDTTLDWSTKYPEQQICLIGSEKVTNNTELLQLLESRHNILLIERDYNVIGNTKHLFFSDIDVDVNTAIVIEDLETMIDDCVVQNAVTKVVALSLKYTSCWFILFSYRKSGSYHFPGHVISNITRLQAAISNFTQRSENFQAKVIFCEGCSELSSMIRCVSEKCILFNKSNATSTWLDTVWRTNEISKEERFLLMLPCFNSMSAQLLLKKVSLRGIFNLPLEDLTEAVPEISVRILKALKHLICSSTGLHLREFPIMRSCRKEVSADENQDVDQGKRDEIHPTEEIYPTENEECLPENSLQDSNKELTRDMYVPEDFQKCNGNSDGSCKQFIHVNEIQTNANTRKGDGNRDIYNAADCIKQSGEDTLSKKNPIEISAGKNKEYGWKSLDQFISGNAVSNKSGIQFDYVKAKSDNFCSRKLNPVEKLHMMRQRDQLQRSTLHKDFNFNYGTVDITDTDEEIGRDVIAKSNQGQLNNSLNKIEGLTQKHAGLSAKHFEKQCVAISEETYLKNRNIDISANAYQSGNFKSSSTEHCQKTTGLQKTTFEYNHGLPFRINEAYRQPLELNSVKEMPDAENSIFHNIKASQFDETYINRHFGYVTGYRTPQKRIDIEKEFPPAEEIDRSVSFESGFESKANNHDMSPKIYSENIEGSAGLSYSNKNECEKDSITYTLSDFAGAENGQVHGQVCHSKNAEEGRHASEMMRESDNATKFQTRTLFLMNEKNDNQEFKFNPQLVDNCSNDEPQLVQQSHINRQDLYLNPKLDRISHKVDQFEETARSSAIHTHSLEDDLRETTKKLLANSRQFSRFDIYTKRHASQKVSIGLAQPRLRNRVKDSKDELPMSEEGHRMMAESLWATEDSPPMDLEYENQEFIRTHHKDTANRVSYTNQTPHKKRKLTYQCVPGKKGQTQLIFE